MSRSRLSTLGLLLLLSACADAATDPFVAPAEGNAAISDAMHGQDRNPHFFWLPPMVDQPASALLGEPELQASPRVVVVCRATNQLASCDTAQAIESTVTPGMLAEFTRGAGLDAGSSMFQVDFDTRAFGLSASSADGTSFTTYRVVVYTDPLPDLGGPFVLGYADFQVGETGREAKNLTTGDMIGLVDGRTLPVKFRIDKGAYAYALKDAAATAAGDPADQPLCQENCIVAIVGADDTTTVALKDAVGLEVTAVKFLPGDVSATSVLVIDERVTEGEEANCANGVTLQKKYCYRYRIFPDETFNNDVRFGICPRDVPLDAGSLWRILKVDYDNVGAPIVTRPPEVDVRDFLPCEGASASLMSRLFRYALDHVAPPLYAQTSTRTWGGTARDFSDLFWALDAAMTPASATDTTLAAGFMLAPTVLVQALYPEPDVALDSARVTFRITGGDGWLNAPGGAPVVDVDSAGGHAVAFTLLTDADGLAHVEWTVGPGTNTLEATSPDALTPDLAPLVFTAQGQVDNGSLAARVYYSDAPVAGVTVELRHGLGPQGEVLQTVLTDGAGYFEFADLPAGTYDLSFDAGPDYRAIGWGGMAVPGSPVLTMYLEKYVTLISPVDFTSVWTLQPELRWQPLAEAVIYHVTLYRIGDGSADPVFAADVAGTSVAVPTPLEEGGQYTWMLAADDADGHQVGVSGSEGVFTVVSPMAGIAFHSVSRPPSITNSIWVVGRDGATLQRLTDDAADDRNPAWSPGGGDMAFESQSRGSSESRSIWLMTAAGTDLRQLTDDAADDGSPAWSPDGLQIAFTSFSRTPSTTPSIWVMGAGGSTPRPLTDDLGYDYEPSWSPDGSRITFHSRGRDATDSYQIWVVNADGSDLHPLTEGWSWNAGAAWSPDGARIAFYAARGTSMSLWVMNADGSGLWQLTDDDGLDYSPTWSPDGLQIAFHSVDRGTAAGSHIWVINADGTGLRQLTDDAAVDYAPTWSSH